MATTVATLIAKLEAQTRDFERNIGNAERKLNDLNTASGNARGGVDRLTGLMRGAAALGLMTFATQIYDLGVQVEAWGRRFETVFGDSSGVVSSWADTMNERMGLSEERLQGAAAAVGDLLVPMGYTRQEAANMSTDILDLSQALSEWTGGQRDAEEISGIIVRAILGEREALIGLGVKVSEADVQARLLAKGQDTLTGSALEQAKAQATLELITGKSADAVQAFADGGPEALLAANNLKASVDDLKVAMSDLLVNAAPLVAVMADIVGVLAKPFTPHVAATILDARDALLEMSAAQLEATRTNGMLYDQISRTLMLLGGKDFGAKGQTFGPKGLGTPNFMGSNHSGGMVPGPSGATVPIMAMAGERVIPAGLSGGGGGSSVNVYVAGSVVSERDLVDAVRRGLRGERIRGGSLEF